MEGALAEAKWTLEGSPSAAELNAAREKLTNASHKLAEAMYKANAATGGAGVPDAATNPEQPEAEQKKDEGVIDAEYVDVDEKK